MTASVDIITESKDGILTVPLAAVTTRAPESEDDEDSDEEDNKVSNDDFDEVVFVLKEGVAVQTKVKTGISDFENIEILQGLDEGTEVISGPFIEVSKRLEDGDKVEPEKKKKKKKKKKDK